MLASRGGTLTAAECLALYGRAIALSELYENLVDYDLPLGVQGTAIVNSDEDPLHVSLIRCILLRMMGWLHRCSRSSNRKSCMETE